MRWMWLAQLLGEFPTADYERNALCDKDLASSRVQTTSSDWSLRRLTGMFQENH